MSAAFTRLVVIGASAGGIETLRALVAGLPAEFPAPICLVVHTAPQSPGVLEEILNRSGSLRAVNGRTGERLRPGRIYVAPPDQHLLVEPGIVRVARGPKENGFRPAIDPLFRSAAQVYGPGAIGVILTGNLDDGVAGLSAIKQLGGVVVVQDPRDALYPAMPSSAASRVPIDYSVPLAEMPRLLVRLAGTPVHEQADIAVPHQLTMEVSIAKEENAIDAGLERFGTPSPYACPDCHGVLLELKEASGPRFRCHTGHAYSSESLLAGVAAAIEADLWTAIRSLEEGSLLLQEFARHLQDHGDRARAERYAAQADEARRHAERVREIVIEREPLADAVKS
jgi:two-component system, chemotaxis family, protein-glutamate methylesterase/glutaminase